MNHYCHKCDIHWKSDLKPNRPGAQWPPCPECGNRENTVSSPFEVE